jgi:hypothetical protein
MRELVFCSLVLCAVGCSSDDGDGSIVSGGTGGGYALVGGTSSTSSKSSSGGMSASATTGGASASTGGDTAMSSTTTTAGGSATSTGGSSAVQTTATASVGGTSPSTGGASSLPSDQDASTGFTVAPCGKYVANAGGLLCPIVLKSSSKSLADRSTGFYGGCGPTEPSAANGWDVLCDDVLCTSTGECVCETKLPKGYWLETNAELTGEGLWAVGNTGSGMELKWNFLVQGELLTTDDVVQNAQKTGYNYRVKIDC